MKWKERGMVSMINKDYFKYLIKQNKKYLISYLCNWNHYSFSTNQ